MLCPGFVRTCEVSEASLGLSSLLRVEIPNCDGVPETQTARTMSSVVATAVCNNQCVLIRVKFLLINLSCFKENYNTFNKCQQRQMQSEDCIMSVVVTEEAVS